MAHPARYVCQECGAVSAKWSGKCDSCGEWNTFTEEAARKGPPGSLQASRGLSRDSRKLWGAAQGQVIEFTPLGGTAKSDPRWRTGIEEFDLVCGGGLVKSSVLLVGGDPGIGKSTLLLQICAALGGQGHDTIYISGEESVEQLQLRAQRLGLDKTNVLLAAETSLRDILASMENGQRKPPRLLVIDSIQTIWTDTLEAAPGTVSQVRACAHELVRFAKKSQTSVVMVGHVTKDGQIAGPRVVEHMVDSVLYFEGERGDRFRILRAVKNRFGAADEIGVFDMSDAGLRPVANPSVLFLDNRGKDVSGTAVFAGIEGSRPVLVEIQALVAVSALATPRRAVVGWDTGRLAMVLAVLDSRCGLGLGAMDVYLNVAGGLRISEPAADLAVAAALISSRADVAVAANAVVFGEISLSGAVRPVTQMDVRLKEAAKLGFTRAIIPGAGDVSTSLEIKEVDVLPVLADIIGAGDKRHER